ncbi:START domain containing protein [Entamoeba histolytica HM-1:IMSS-B]|uniref:START domain containing protein n=6 Tax=Entamoeba histolytica TaxID=5759 RepID=C4M6Y4_ENTH1|nr:START domain containing protein [Entamoeba histolytica HM-1:IMSS]EMD43614.1 START domain containing protein [Entamoeba histolytica KU27]EMH77922.1 START domain containing protein [Entamoeba histolytica HM-1:IMSS-B]EMS11733.1 START domain containing protein [Entamoeba histolytica HM-3:IMSS]ENY63091.1 START domain containing protein [Entamoeba histolytica HM-1:IMSS-A]GAT97281.1 start domain containing protein [Entamoeba histolytica]|eukprot:XP_650723.1 START domain containing protein [Entamoeba histolytica HM-1:IMSS]
MLSSTITEFREYCLNNDEWQECLKDETQTEYMRATKNNSVVSLKVISNDFKTFEPKEVYESICDPEFHKEWDPYLISWTVIDTKNEQTNVIRMLFKVPVITNREFVFDCETCCNEKDGCEEYFIRFESTDSDKYLVSEGYVRGSIGLSGYLIRKENNQTVLYCIGNSDIGGVVPKWIVNSMAKSTVPTMLKGLREKLAKYREWKNKQNEKK